MIDWSNFGGFFSTGVPSMVLYWSLAVTVIAIVMVLFKGSKRASGSRSSRANWRYVLWVLLAEYVFIVICSTIICRGTQSFEFARLELTPFWTYKAVLAHTPGVSVWDIILNVLLFFPLGMLVKLIYPNISLLKTIGIGIVCSICIEANQFVFEKGIAQIDDVIHNTLGCMIGWGMAKLVQGLRSSISSRKIDI